MGRLLGDLHRSDVRLGRALRLRACGGGLGLGTLQSLQQAPFILVLVLLSSDPTATLVMLGLTWSTVVACVAYVPVLHHRRLLVWPRIALRSWALLFATGLRGMGVGISDSLTSRLDRYLVGFFLLPAAVGFYAVAATTSELFRLIPTSVMQVLFPRLASRTRGLDTVARARRACLAIVVAAVGAVIFVAPWGVLVVFGSTYLPAVTPLQVLLLGEVGMTLFIVDGSAISAFGMTGRATLAAAAGLAVVAAADAVLIPRHGIVGAAWASVLAYWVMGISARLAMANALDAPVHNGRPRRSARTDPPAVGGDMTAPLVSVVIPTFNRWPLVQEAVNSVLSQQLHDLEVLVVDDGSTDGTADRLVVHHAVRLVRQANTERGAARNRGLREARGRYVAFLDADDVFEPWHLAQFEERLAASGEGVFAAQARSWDPATGHTWRRPIPRQAWTELDDAALRGTVLPLQGLVVPRDVALEVGGFPEARAASGSEDWVFLVRLSRCTAVAPLPRPGVRIREHPGRSMNDPQARISSRLVAMGLLLDEGVNGRELDERSRRLVAAGTYRTCAAHAYRIGQMQDARAYLAQIHRELGLAEALSWTGRLWLQTWFGRRGSRAAWRAKEAWRRR